jgi:hypothetical protein
MPIRAHKHSKLKPPQRLMVGLNEIAAYVGVSPLTVTRWSKHNGFPIAKRPDGLYTTSARLVDLWLLVHMRAQRGELVS